MLFKFGKSLNGDCCCSDTLVVAPVEKGTCCCPATNKLGKSESETVVRRSCLVVSAKRI